MSNDTLQFAVRALVVTVCVAVLGIIGIDGAAIFAFGDGEALSLIGQLNGPLLGALGALGSATVLHQVASAVIARLIGVAATPAAPAPATVGTVQVPVSIPAAHIVMNAAPAPETGL